MIRVGIGSDAGGAGERTNNRPAPPPLDQVAKEFPHLEIIDVIGWGGMGVVYKARQPSLDRYVALKVLLTRSVDDPSFKERFTREARSLAKLSHPHIVAVYDVGQTDHFHYFMMEYVDGINLRQMQQAGRLPSREALNIIPQICEALQFAHDEGIVHRDIKPENVLIDKKGRVKIADFGLAKILGLEPADFRLTRDKEVVGTPHYIAPEQIERPQEVDHRADIFSLGVVFYEMLTGELPIGRFAPPSERVQVDVRFDEVVLRALEKEPARRYQQISEIRTDIRAIDPVTSQLAEQSPKRSKPISGRKLIVIGIVALPFLAGLSVWFFPAPAELQNSDLLAQWQAEDAGRDKVSGNYATLQNVQFDHGIKGQAFRFDGKRGTINVPRSTTLDPGNQLTIAFWMKADSDNLMDTCCQGLVTCDVFGIEISPGYTTQCGINFVISTDRGATMIDTSEAPNGLGVNGGAVVTRDQWHQIVGAYDGTKLQLYIDGQAWGAPRFHNGKISPMRQRNFLSIGSEDGKVDDPGDCVGTRYFKGLIDEVSIYSRALSPGEIASSYRKLKTN
ncbi:MAG: protein kinase domain-containing protein [Verrucomicrobiota bacterium]